MSAVRTVSAFQRDATPMLFQKGETIFKAGEVGETMYGVIRGEVELWVQDQLVEVIHQGDVFGEGALVQPSQVRASSAIARTDCELASLDQSRFLFAVQNTPMFAIEIMRSFSSRLRRLKQVAASGQAPR
ncbi:cyclic nucleotide-binding domain-containing protein [Lyngbya confervoides]|uniref:Cyclic nucleotide-binding domain-containing protein n=1 Tax=Lyngbya confervoides BDU141951 TaxID=1574623 RepID=A0ABD4T8V0_9CYAN|nr:cyclic nucleotide-binding domain-containing protein [Lyngbya confervoides]MCM1985036.1 cyclic nucleotide-binding domain-containing protein [Lyngbya confervoides BDU141951]